MDEKRFIDLWRRCGSTTIPSKAAGLFSEIQNHYAESQRVYHTASHICHCLLQVDLIDNDCTDKDAIELAIWFHDVIYEIGDPENEANSAKWFREQAQDDLPDALIDQVDRMIMATRHFNPPERLDEQYVVDVDLSGFGLPWQAFIQDSDNVRAEFPDVADRVFLVSHRAFLEKLISREQIFCTPLFSNLYDQQARENIQKKLAMTLQELASL